VLARRRMPPKFMEWNEQWGAPFGYPRKTAQRFWGKFLSQSMVIRLGGPFCIQPNTKNRKYEYPWAFQAVPIEEGMRVADLGGGLAGFQFVLDKTGAQVVNIDPGLDAEGLGWKCDEKSMAMLNRLLGTTVKLENTTIIEASIEKESLDVVYSISVLEHLAEETFWDTVKGVWDALKVGGKFVVTTDLFLNLHPFASRKTNRYGTNFPIAQIDGFETFELISDDPKELYGSDSFDTDHILSHLEEFCVGSYPAMAQCLVLEKK